MAKQQTLTIVVPDDGPDPADLVREALVYHYPTWSEKEARDPDLTHLLDFDVAADDFVLILEED